MKEIERPLRREMRAPNQGKELLLQEQKHE